MGTGQVAPNPARGTDEVGCIAVVLFHAGCNGQHVRIKNNVFRKEPDFIDQQAIGTVGNGNTAFVGSGLPFLVETHDNNGCTKAFDFTGMGQEDRFALFERNGIDNALALHAFQACADDGPVA